jgi:tryptophanyl-tRNA synthetase
MKQTILTGIRVNSDLTLGNFLGAMLPITRLANRHSKNSHINIFVPDLHTIIAEIDGNLQVNLVKSIKYYLAAGLELNKNIHIYRQSRVPAHSELTWILDCFATMGEMSRMIQYKEKSNEKDTANVGIFNYPVLMTADILLYDATVVPVGEDQFQHIELTRNLAIRVNHKLGQDIFTVPDAPVATTGLRIRDLVHPDKKMSKSARSENAKIMLSDAPEAAAAKILSATTDSEKLIKFDMFNQPGISNLLQILSAITDQPLQQVILEYAGQTAYGPLKQKVADTIQNFLTDFQAKVATISDRDVFELLKVGESYANTVANRKLYAVQAALGLRRD